METENSPLVSIIVPVYNVANYIGECLDSLLNQTYRNIEIILINDGSSDESEKICKEYLVNDPRIKYVYQDNAGLSMARNRGIDLATGEYLTFVDSDDYIKDYMIEVMIKAIANTGAEIALAKMTEFEKLFFDDTVIPNPVEMNSEKVLKAIFKEKHITTSASAKIYKKELWKDVKYPQDKIFEDYYTIYKLIDKASKCVFVNNYVYYYRPNPSGIMKTKFDKRKLQYFDATEEIIDYMKNNHPILIKDVNNRTCRYAISFYNSYAQSHDEDLVVKDCLVANVKNNISGYMFSHYSLLSKAYGLLICISSKLACQLFK